jgi:hypothetical protein
MSLSPIYKDNFQRLCGLCLFICGLFNDSVSNIDYKASNDWLVVSNQLERTWKHKGLHNEELHNLYSFPSIIKRIKSRRMRWAGYVARMWGEAEYI